MKRLQYLRRYFRRNFFGEWETGPAMEAAGSLDEWQDFRRGIEGGQPHSMEKPVCSHLRRDAARGKVPD